MIAKEQIGYSIAVPEYEISENWVTATFARPKLKNGVRVQDAKSGPESGKNGGPMGGPMGGPNELTDRQKQIVELIQADNQISLRNLAKHLEINRSALDKHIDTLKEKGVLRRIGGTRGHWEVLK